MSHTIKFVKSQMYGFMPAAVCFTILLSFAVHRRYLPAAVVEKKDGSYFQGHLDTLTLFKTQTDCRLVVKNDQLGLFVSCCAYMEQIINLLLLTAF